MLEEFTKAMSGPHRRGVSPAISRACFSMMYSGPTAGTVFWQAMQTGGDHERTHDEAGTQPLVSASRVFIMQCLADLLVALQGITEGAGNVLDNTVILGSTDVADGQAHTLNRLSHHRGRRWRRVPQTPRCPLPLDDGREHQHRADERAEGCRRDGSRRNAACHVRRRRRPRHELLYADRSVAISSLRRSRRVASAARFGMRLSSPLAAARSWTMLAVPPVVE